MADYDSTELIALCGSILDDGEVTADEAYQLADWLNKHDEACEHWPGKDLVKPFQEIWADGSVNKRELHRLARLLISIQREWARRPQTKISSVTDDPIPEFPVADIDDVRLPSLHGKFRVPSQSEQGKFYEVDLSGPSCTCPDWRTWRSRLPVGDLTRCCKHVLHVYAKLARRGKTDGWLIAFIDNGWPAHPGAKWQLLTVGSDKVLFCTASDKGWANVFAKEAREYCRFGFNVDEGRWAYGIEPPSAATIAAAIASCSKSGASPPQPPSDRAERADKANINPRVAPAVWIAVAIAGFTIIFALARNTTTQSKSRTAFGTSTIVEKRERPRPVERQTSPVAQPATSQTLNTSPSNIQPTVWSAKTIRTVRAKTDHGELIIPKGAQLRLIGRSRATVMISYEGKTLTIPAAATDLK